jgi:hypothetical protein
LGGARRRFTNPATLARQWTESAVVSVWDSPFTSPIGITPSIPRPAQSLVVHRLFQRSVTGKHHPLNISRFCSFQDDGAWTKPDEASALFARRGGGYGKSPPWKTCINSDFFTIICCTVWRGLSLSLSTVMPYIFLLFFFFLRCLVMSTTLILTWFGVFSVCISFSAIFVRGMEYVLTVGIRDSIFLTVVHRHAHY